MQKKNDPRFELSWIYKTFIIGLASVAVCVADANAKSIDATIDSLGIQQTAIAVSKNIATAEIIKGRVSDSKTARFQAFLF